MKGIYQITDLSTGNFYIGSSINVYNRIKRHQKDLLKNTHRNSILQRIYNKRGPENLEYLVLYFMDDYSRREILDKEQYLLDTLKPLINISKSAYGPYIDSEHLKKAQKASQEKCSKEYIITYPSGESLKIKSLSGFAKKNDIHPSALHRVATGERRHYKGIKVESCEKKVEWRSKKIKTICSKSKKYKAINIKTGDEIVIKHNSKFCEDYKISKSCFYRCTNEKKCIDRKGFYYTPRTANGYSFVEISEEEWLKHYNYDDL